jgi:hypothetical protein
MDIFLYFSCMEAHHRLHCADERQKVQTIACPELPLFELSRL